MHDFSAENHIHSIFKSIHAEVLSKQKYLQQLESEVEDINIDELEENVRELRNDVSELEMRNTKYSYNIKINKLLISQHDEQSALLRALFDEFQNKVKSYTDQKGEDLPEDTKQEINDKIKAIIQQMWDLGSIFDKESIEQEYKKLHEINKQIKNEISILKQFPDDWDSKDGFDNIFSQNEPLYFDNLNQDIYPFQFTESNISINTNDNQHAQSNLMRTQLEKEIQNSLEKLDNRNSTAKSFYANQIEFLTSLKNTLTHKTIQPDVADSKLKSQIYSDIPEINSIVTNVPDFNASTDMDQSIKVLTDSFNEFSKSIQSELEANSVHNKLSNSVEESLKIPEFQPPKITLTENSVTDRDLAQLSDNLQTLIQSANQNQSIQDSIKILQEILDSKLNHLNSDDELFDSFARDSESPQPIEPPTNNPKLLELEEVLKAKLPDELLRKIQSQELNIRIEQIPNTTEFAENQQHSTITNISQSESSAKERAEELNRILNDLLQDDDLSQPELFKSLQCFKPPVPCGVKMLPVNQQPIMDAISSILKPSQQSQVSLPDDISKLKQIVASLETKLDNETNAYEDEKQKEEELDNEIKEAETDKINKESEWKMILSDVKAKKDEEVETIKLISDLESKIKEIDDITDAVIAAKEAELNAKTDELLQAYLQA